VDAKREKETGKRQHDADSTELARAAIRSKGIGKALRVAQAYDTLPHRRPDGSGETASRRQKKNKKDDKKEAKKKNELKSSDVGVGNIGSIHGGVYSQNPNVEIVASLRHHQEKSGTGRRRYSCQGFYFSQEYACQRHPD